MPAIARIERESGRRAPLAGRVLSVVVSKHFRARVDDQEFYQLLDKGGITDDIHLFNEKLREWEDSTSYHRRMEPSMAKPRTNGSWPR